VRAPTSVFCSDTAELGLTEASVYMINSCIEQIVPCKRAAVLRKSDYIKYAYRVQAFIYETATACKVYHSFKTHESFESYNSAARGVSL
jgi:hypothetical protein